jgi:hypothetical protein
MSRVAPPAFSDPRYLRVDGTPLFLLDGAGHHPDPVRTTERWRAQAQRLGSGELSLCSMQIGVDARVDPATLGFDAVVRFAPFYRRMRRRGRTLPPRVPHRVAHAQLCELAVT